MAFPAAGPAVCPSKESGMKKEENKRRKLSSSGRVLPWITSSCRSQTLISSISSERGARGRRPRIITLPADPHRKNLYALVRIEPQSESNPAVRKVMQILPKSGFSRNQGRIIPFIESDRIVLQKEIPCLRQIGSFSQPPAPSLS